MASTPTRRWTAARRRRGSRCWSAGSSTPCSNAGPCLPGIEFASKAVLRTRLGLLGARTPVEQMAALGFVPIALVVVGIVTTLVVGYALARSLGLSREFGLLSGGSVGICGASAAL